jgi:hypothetical protein
LETLRRSIMLLRPGESKHDLLDCQSWSGLRPFSLRIAAYELASTMFERMIDYASTISGSRLMTKATTSLRSGSETSKVSRLTPKQRMKAA